MADHYCITTGFQCQDGFDFLCAQAFKQRVSIEELRIAGPKTQLVVVVNACQKIVEVALLKLDIVGLWHCVYLYFASLASCWVQI